MRLNSQGLKNQLWIVIFYLGAIFDEFLPDDCLYNGFGIGNGIVNKFHFDMSALSNDELVSYSLVFLSA